MAPKRYTLERLSGVAADSAATWQTTLKLKDLTCECIYEAQEVPIRGTTNLKFLWQIASAGYSDQCEIEARCDNVLERGVPFPDRWQTAVKALSL